MPRALQYTGIKFVSHGFSGTASTLLNGSRKGAKWCRSGLIILTDFVLVPMLFLSTRALGKLTLHESPDQVAPVASGSGAGGACESAEFVRLC